MRNFNYWTRRTALERRLAISIKIAEKALLNYYYEIGEKVL
jgi:hypothetical protein